VNSYQQAFFFSPPTTTTTMQFEHGQEVVLLTWRQPCGISKVERVTKTLAIVQGKKFNRITGNSYGPQGCVRLGGRDRHITGIQLATDDWRQKTEETLRGWAEKEEEQTVRWELRKLSDRFCEKLGNLSLEDAIAATEVLRDLLKEGEAGEGRFGG
jgi:hypothetical protein